MNAEYFGLRVMGSSGGEQLVICPFHDDRKPSAWWNPIKNVFYCSVCQVGLGAYQLAEKLGADTEGLEDNSEPDSSVEDYDLMDTIEAPYRQVHYDCYCPYLEKRGISKDVAKEYNVGIVDSAPEAIHFVVKDISNHPTGYVQRFIGKGAFRYKKVGMMQPLWPMPMLMRLEPDERLFIFEGPFSAMRWTTVLPYLKGFALMGAKANKTIASMVRDINPVFLYDHDTAGINACYRMRELLPTAHCYTLNISVDDMDDKQIHNLIAKLSRKENW